MSIGPERDGPESECKMKMSLKSGHNALKRTIVFADERTKRVVDGGLAIIADADRSNLSAAAEKLLLEMLVTDRPEVSGPMSRILAGDSTVKDELASAFRSNAAGAYPMALSPHMRPLVLFASRFTACCVMDLGRDERHHAMSCWDSIVRKLREASGEDGMADARRTAACIGDCLVSGWDMEASLPLNLIASAWDELGDYTYTFRFLADAIDMIDVANVKPSAVWEFRDALIECSNEGWDVV